MIVAPLLDMNNCNFEILYVMKTIILLSVAILLSAFPAKVYSQQVASSGSDSKSELVTVQCSPDLYQLASTWAAEYCRLNPGKQVRIEASGANSAAPGTTENLGFISSKTQSAPMSDKAWRMVIGRDIIVPVMNASNPYLNEISRTGFSPETLAGIFNNPEKQSWNILAGETKNAAMHIYMVNDNDTKNAVAKFLQLNQLPVSGISFGTSQEVAAAVQKDPYAIAFCKLVSVTEPVTQKLLDNIRLLPIDKNGNGTLDYMEDIYANADVFMRGVWIGKYPKALYTNIYVVSALPPENESELAFLSWVLAGGQQYMKSKGFIELAENESQMQLEKINTPVLSVTPANDASQSGLILFILAVVVGLGLVIGVIVRSYRRQENVTPVFSDEPQSFNQDGVKLPQGLFFDKTHTWAFMEKDGNVTIGIDDFLQHVTGPITRVEMKNPGDKIKKGELLLSVIQSGKQLHVYSPVSGIIKKQNEVLKTEAGALNSAPYAEGWVYQVEPSGWLKETQLMDMAGKYKLWIDNEFSRLKDFLASTLNPGSLEYSHVVMQDGGVLKEGVLAEFGPEVWDDFQTKFLDTYK